MPKKSIKKNKTSNRVDCLWGIMCSMSSHDKDKNNISLFNVIDQLNIPDQIKEQVVGTGLGLEHELVFVFRRLLKTELCTERLVIDLKISAMDPEGKVLGEILTQMVLEPGKRILRFRVQNNAFKITKEGDYVYKAEIIQPGEDSFTLAAEIPYIVQFID